MPESRLTKDVYDVWQSRKGRKQRRQNNIGLERNKQDCTHAQRKKPSKQRCTDLAPHVDLGWQNQGRVSIAVWRAGLTVESRQDTDAGLCPDRRSRIE